MALERPKREVGDEVGLAIAEVSRWHAPPPFLHRISVEIARHGSVWLRSVADLPYDPKGGKVTAHQTLVAPERWQGDGLPDLRSTQTVAR